MNVGQTNIRTPYSQQFQKYLGKKIHYKSLVWIFFVVNMLNYVERSIIPGSVVEIKQFVEEMVGHDPDTYVGLLQSSFILGFSVASVIFGFFVSLSSPFSVICIGLGVWVLATVLSGCAWSYVSLFIARLFSGVGEAAFQIVVPAFIDDYSPKNLVGTSMSILYMAIPVGTALGYTMSGYIAEHYSWRIMYIISGPLMIPFIIILLYYPINSISEIESPLSLLIEEDRDNSFDSKFDKEDGDLISGEVVVSKSPEQEQGGEGTSSTRIEEEEEATVPIPNSVDDQLSSSTTKTSNQMILRGVGTMISTPPFILAVLGEAACVFISSGFTSFGNVFLMELHMFSTESASALVVGCTGCFAGIIGATLGGYTLDWLLRLRDSFTTLYNYYSHLFIFSLIAVSFCLLCSVSLTNRYFFIAFFFLGCTAIFAANPSWTLVILHTSPPHIRSLAVGIATIMYHLLGDVPAPILIGKMMDVAIEKAGDDPEQLYNAYKTTLQLTLSISITIVLSWGLGYLLIYRSKEYGPAINKKSSQPKEGIGGETGVVVVGDDSDQSSLAGDERVQGVRDFKSRGISPSILEDDREIIAVSNAQTLISVHSSIVIVESDDEQEDYSRQEEQDEERNQYIPTQMNMTPATISTELTEITA